MAKKGLSKRFDTYATLDLLCLDMGNDTMNTGINNVLMKCEIQWYSYSHDLECFFLQLIIMSMMPACSSLWYASGILFEFSCANPVSLTSAIPCHYLYLTCTMQGAQYFRHCLSWAKIARFLKPIARHLSSTLILVALLSLPVLGHSQRAIY